MAGTETIAEGAYIIDMGQPNQTYATGLKPYGLLFDLVVNKGIPLKWAIEPSKVQDGVDFTAGGKSYSGGSFIIEADYVNEAAATITNWQGQGVVVDGPISSSFTAPIYETIKSFPRVVLDDDSGGIAEPYYGNAGIPETTNTDFGIYTTYRYDYPSGLSNCDDLYVMPHADPEWTTHSNLIAFNQSTGGIWAACHAVSVLEEIDDPGDGDTLPDMNFLSTNEGLINFGDHEKAGSLPYSYESTTNSTVASHPIMQFMGTMDGAQENGSEQIYLPKNSSNWRPETTVAVYDPDHVDVVSGNSPGLAAKVAYGRGFGNNNNGWVMYEAGHSHAKSSAPENVAAQRAFFNLHLLVGIERRIEVTSTVPNPIKAGTSDTVSISAVGGSGLYNYQWYSSCGGTFDNPNAATTNFNAPSEGGSCVVRVVVEDSCGRRTVDANPLIIQGAEADLGITKTDNLTEITGGSTDTYTITVTNNGPDTVSSIKVAEAVPTEILNPSFAASSGIYDSSTGDWTGLNFTPGNILTLTVSGTVDPLATGTMNNTATVSPPPGGVDNNSTNDSATDTTNIITPNADVAVVKTHTPSPLIEKGGVIYTITVTNNGPDTISSIDLTDTFDSSDVGDKDLVKDFTLVPSVGTLSETNPVINGKNPGSFSLTWSDLDLKAGDNAYLTIDVKNLEKDIKNGNTLNNTVSISIPGVNDSNPSNNSFVDSDTLVEDIGEADLSITKVDDVDPIGPDGTLTYTIAVTNNGKGKDISVLRLLDALPSEIKNPTFINPSEGAVSGSFNATTNLWEIDWTGLDLDKETITFQIQGAIAADAEPSTINNVVSVSAPGYLDKEGENNTATENTTIELSADLAITKDDSLTQVNPGDNITYIMTITNNGPDTVKSLSVTDDPLPSELLTPSFTPSAGVYNSGTGEWTGLNLGSGDSITLSLTGRVNPTLSGGSNITNTAVVSSPTGVTDPVPSNNSATDNNTAVIPQADLAITKDDGQTSAVPGAAISYALKVTNKGPTPVSTLTVTDTVPAEITNPTFTPSAGSYNSSTGQWTGLTLNAGNSATLTLSGTVDVTASGTLTNTAAVSSPIDDPNPDNNSATDVDTLTPRADLAIAKDDGVTEAPPGSTVNYTITVTNNGPSTVSSMSVVDDLPPALASPSFTESAGTYNSTTGEWTGLNLAAGNSETLTLTGTVVETAVGNLTNSVRVTPSGGVADSNQSNNSDTDIDLIAPGTADLAINKTDDKIVAIPGTPLTYTITVTNNGPDPVQSVTVTDDLPTQIVADDITFSTPDGRYNSTTGEWTGFILRSGDNIKLLLDVTVDATATLGDSLTNTITVSPPPNFTDPNSANNSSSDTDTIANSEPTGSIAGTVYQDNNINDSFDTEPTLPPGITVSLLSSDGSTVISTATTLPDGTYSFAPVPDGNYLVRVDNTDPDIPSGLSLGTSNDLPVSVTGGAITDVNFGFDGTPDLLLVKRITSINGNAITSTVNNSVDNPSTLTNEATGDDHANWPTPIDSLSGVSTYLKGAIDGGAVKPGDEVEYTIYFLSGGAKPMTNVNVCDIVPNNTTYLDNSSEIAYGTASAIADGQLLPNGSTASCRLVQSATTPVVVFNLADNALGEQLPNATGPGTPNNSYGYVRFRVTVD